MTTLHWIDYAIMLLYFAFVLGIGAMLRRYVHTSEDFFLSGRSIPAWVTGLAFISANLGAQEVIGMGASGAKYGIATSHFYWVGAIPAMVFVGLFMMPFYYGSRARSVPEYLKLRFDEKTRGLNAVSFAVMTVFSSGISLYAMGKLLNLLLGWSFDASILVAGGIVLGYIFLGGLTSAIYNEVLQFFLIVSVFAPLVFLVLRDVGGWAGLSARLAGGAGRACRRDRPGCDAHSVGAGRFRAAAGDRAPEARHPHRPAAARRAWPRGAGLRPRHADAAGALLPRGVARARTHGAAGVVHVGDGRQRDGLQHGVDVRSVPELRSARRSGFALPRDGPIRHRVRRRRLHCGRVRRGLVQQHHGLPPARVRVRERAVVRDVRTGDVLAARHRTRSVRGTRLRDTRRGGASRAVAPCRSACGREGRLPRRRHDLSERAGADVLDGHRRLGDLLRRDDPREPRHARAGARRAAR